MGTSHAAVVFKTTTAIDLKETIAALTGHEATEMHGLYSLDTRTPGNIVTEQYGDACFIFSSELVQPLLHPPQSEAVAQLYIKLGKPALIVAYCWYDSGDTWGYTIIENGQAVRSRLQSCGPDVLEAGAPKQFEQAWLSAPFYLEDDDTPEDAVKVFYKGDREHVVAEYGLTSRMLRELLDLEFQVCPATTRLKPNRRYFTLSAPAPSSPTRPWWRRFWP